MIAWGFPNCHTTSDWLGRCHHQTPLKRRSRRAHFCQTSGLFLYSFAASYLILWIWPGVLWHQMPEALRLIWVAEILLEKTGLFCSPKATKDTKDINISYVTFCVCCNQKNMSKSSHRWILEKLSATFPLLNGSSTVRASEFSQKWFSLEPTGRKRLDRTAPLTREACFVQQKASHQIHDISWWYHPMDAKYQSAWNDRPCWSCTVPCFQCSICSSDPAASGVSLEPGYQRRRLRFQTNIPVG